jgi:hypothetical protein
MMSITPFILLAALAAQRPASSDTVPPVPAEAVARVTFDFGSGASTALLVQDFEAGFAPSASASSNAGSVRVHFAKAPDSLTPELARRGASAERIPSVTIEVLGGAGGDKTLMTFRLSDALVASDRVAVDNGAADLQQQRLALEDGIAQLRSDLQDAQRQLALTDALDKKKLSSTLEVARARDRAQLLETKLAVQKRRLDLLDKQIAAHLAVKEEITLVVPKFEIETSAGVRTAWSVPQRGARD